MSESLIAGGCLCGQVRYTLREAPSNVEYCHCGMCRKQTGAPVAGWIDVPQRALSWEGGKPSEYASSPEARRGFCGNCGSALYFRWLAGGDKISLAVGGLDDPGRFPPTKHIYHADKTPWLKLADGLPRHDAGAPDTGPGD